MNATGGFKPTHRVPRSGLHTWEAPEPNATAGPRLDPGLEVEVVERLPDGWTRIVCSNGWSAWVDGRFLEEGPAPARRGLPAAVDPFLLGGAALAFVGSVTPWLSLGDRSVSSWQLPLVFLLTGRGGLAGLKAGLVLLLGLLGGAAYVTARSASRVLVLMMAMGVTALAVDGLMLGLRTDLQPSLGVGIFLTLAGGLAMAADYARLRSVGRGAAKQ